MSYINDALRKVQKEKESRYAAYEHMVSAPGKKPDWSKKWLSITGILIVFFLAAGIIVLLYWLEDTRIPAKIISASPLTVKVPAQKTSAPPVAPAVVNAVSTKPQVVKEMTADKKNKTGLNRETASSSTPKVKTEIAKAKVKVKALFAQALERQHEGKLEEAKELYRKVVKIDQNNAQAFNNLGVIYMGEKQYKRAIMRFNDALNIKHDYPDAYYNLACLYAQENDAARSLLYLKNAIEFNPEVRHWAENDGDLKTMVDLPEFKKLLEKQ
ncbi:MAG: tetratricopeptide repeat protein [Smithella sp.]|jgi:tetratricopeptide (TPR) repeat protein